MEQIDTFKTKTQGISLTRILHCNKYIYYAIQRKKYTNKYNYLAYYPTIEGYDFSDKLLTRASKRFVLKFSKYTGIYTKAVAAADAVYNNSLGYYPID